MTAAKKSEIKNAESNSLETLHTVRLFFSMSPQMLIT